MPPGRRIAVARGVEPDIGDHFIVADPLGGRRHGDRPRITGPMAGCETGGGGRGRRCISRPAERRGHGLAHALGVVGDQAEGVKIGVERPPRPVNGGLCRQACAADEGNAEITTIFERVQQHRAVGRRQQHERRVNGQRRFDRLLTPAISAPGEESIGQWIAFHAVLPGTGVTEGLALGLAGDRETAPLQRLGQRIGHWRQVRAA